MPDQSPLRKYPELSGKTFLIGVGAMRTASSWIYTYLGSLPDVAVSPLKELHFFNLKFPSYLMSDMDSFAVKRLGYYMDQKDDPVPYLRANDAFRASVDRVQMIYDDNAYFGHFARLCRPETRTFCDLTPGYAVIGPRGFEYIKEFCAVQECRVKLLFVMRDPVERMWSQLRHFHDLNPKNVQLDKWQAAIESDAFYIRADYTGTVSDLDTTFDKDDLLYLFYEELFEEKSLRKLCEFAGVAYRRPDFDDHINAARTQTDIPDEVRAGLLYRLEMQYDFCRDRFGDLIPDSWQR